MNEPTPDPATPYVLRFEPRPDHLYVHASGNMFTADVALEAWSRIGGEANRLGLRRLFVENTLNQQLSVTDMFDVGRMMPLLPALRGLRIAMLDTRPEAFGVALFGETVAVNRGLCGRVFNDAVAAMLWLVSDAAP